MSILFVRNHSVGVAVVTALLSFGTDLPVRAATFNAAPLFEEVNSFTTSISSDSLADVYFPTGATSESNGDLLPVALLLQGANVDKSEYSIFASTVASYGFTVVVPNLLTDVFTPFGLPEGLFAEQGQVNDVLSYAELESTNPDSLLNGIVNPDKLVLLGHSFGGSVGLNAIEGSCNFPTCVDEEFTRPPELLGGAFYASALSQANLEGITPPLDNDGIPIALLAGELDGVTPFPLVEETFNQIQQPPRSLITVNGANHYGITNRNNVPTAAFDPNMPTIEQSVAIETIARWSSLFLRGNALGDEGALKYVNRTGDTLDINVDVAVIRQDVPENSSILGLLSFGGFLFVFGARHLQNAHRLE